MDNFNRENLIATLVDNYVYSEALDAKDTLTKQCELLKISESVKDFAIKRVPGKKDALRRVVTDAVDIWTVIDRDLKGEIGVQFVAANPNRIPSSNIEKFNVQFLVTAIAKLQEKVETLTLNHDASVLALK